MRQEDDSEFNTDLENFKELKKRFNFLRGEVKTIHETWQKLHQAPKGRDHLQEHSELIERELEAMKELQQVLDSADEMMRRNIKKIR
jgi:hypothetical protein